MSVNLFSQVLGQTQDHRHRVLVAAAKNIKVWFIKVRKIKAIYYTLNMFNLDVTQKCLIAECWCPVGDLDRIQQALQRGNVSSTFLIKIIHHKELCDLALNSVSSQCTRGKSSIARKPEDHPKIFKW